MPVGGWCGGVRRGSGRGGDGHAQELRVIRVVLRRDLLDRRRRHVRRGYRLAGRRRLDVRLVGRTGRESVRVSQVGRRDLVSESAVARIRGRVCVGSDRGRGVGVIEGRRMVRLRGVVVGRLAVEGMIRGGGAEGRGAARGLRIGGSCGGRRVQGRRRRREGCGACSRQTAPSQPHHTHTHTHTNGGIKSEKRGKKKRERIAYPQWN